MAASSRRTIWILAVALLIVVVLGLLGLWGFWSFLAPALGLSGAASSDPPTQLASVSVSARPNSLAWSADGNYLATGTGGSTAGEAVAFEVYVVDVARASVQTTLKTTCAVAGLAFAPDGKWLAVAQQPAFPDTKVPPELVVFDVPAFTARFTARVGTPENAFVELAWAADSKALLAIDGPVSNGHGKREVRRWDVPAFNEQPVVRALDLNGDAALAVSPDGHTLAISFAEGPTNKSLVQLFDPGKGAERSIRSGDPFLPPRLGFTADGKALGVFDANRLSWWDVATGRPAAPAGARFAVQPAGLSDHRSHAAVAPDGRWQAHGTERHRGLGDLGWDNQAMEFGSFVTLTESATGKARTWRVGHAQEAPVVAISPDGSRLAGTVWQPSGASILIWAVPK